MYDRLNIADRIGAIQIYANRHGAALALHPSFERLGRTIRQTGWTGLWTLLIDWGVQGHGRRTYKVIEAEL